MKICRICRQEKSLDLFHIRKGSPDGHRTECKDCRNAEQRQRRVDNPEHQREIDRNSYLNNIETKKEGKKRYREQNRDKHRADRARRKLQKRQATPSWANKKAVDLFYTKARRLEIWLSTPIQVDHIVPIISDFVCGLHCEANLQLLSQPENGSKGNRHWPDMW